MWSIGRYIILAPPCWSSGLVQARMVPGNLQQVLLQKASGDARMFSLGVLCIDAGVITFHGDSNWPKALQVKHKPNKKCKSCLSKAKLLFLAGCNASEATSVLSTDFAKFELAGCDGRQLGAGPLGQSRSFLRRYPNSASKRKIQIDQSYSSLIKRETLQFECKAKRRLLQHLGLHSIQKASQLFVREFTLWHTFLGWNNLNIILIITAWTILWHRLDWHRLTLKVSRHLWVFKLGWISHLWIFNVNLIRHRLLVSIAT